ncbi:MAG: methyltransferase domain-containing protein, partial [Magnetococcales bacterium]|nr:methyltransferase domain-containing protein [Magnetococcales bacterium]
DFDLILIFHVLEHIDEPSSMIQFCRERLAPNGRLVVEVPYGSGNFLVPWDGHGEHCQFFSTASLSVLLEGRGFAVEKMVNGCYESATYNDSLRVMSRLAVTAEQKVTLFQQRFQELFQGQCIIFGVGKDFQNWFAPYLDEAAVVAVCDNAPTVQGSRVMGKVVQTPLAVVQGRGGVKILVATFRYTSEIIAQLLDMGVREEEIVTTEQFFARSL